MFTFMVFFDEMKYCSLNALGSQKLIQRCNYIKGGFPKNFNIILWGSALKRLWFVGDKSITNELVITPAVVEGDAGNCCWIFWRLNRIMFRKSRRNFEFSRFWYCVVIDKEISVFIADFKLVYWRNHEKIGIYIRAFATAFRIWAFWLPRRRWKRNFKAEKNLQYLTHGHFFSFFLLNVFSRIYSIFL